MIASLSDIIQEPPRSGISLGFRVENSVQILQPFNDVNVLTRNFCFFFHEFQSTKHFGRAFTFPILLLWVLRVLNSVRILQAFDSNTSFDMYFV